MTNKIAKITGVLLTAFAFLFISNTVVFASAKHSNKKHTRSHAYKKSAQKYVITKRGKSPATKKEYASSQVNKKRTKLQAGVIHPIQLRKTKENAQLLCLADNIYFEGRSESTSAQIAIGYVTVNRTRHPDYPDTICEVVKQEGQFSWYKKNKRYVVEEEEAWRKALILAQAVKVRAIPSKYEKAMFFHAKYVRPSWARKKVLAGVEDGHKFYNERRRI